MDIEARISPLVEQQFPSFYLEEGPNFIAFVKAYYAWAEQDGGSLSGSRALLSNMDVDKTIDAFVDHFRAQYLVNLPSSDKVTEAFRIKHIQDLYKAKGTEDGLKLFFRMLYGVRASVYKPGSDILRASDGTWTIPTYLEIEYAESNGSFIGKKIVGATSGATAIVESFASRTINQRIINVMYLSNVRGDFQINEYITNNGSLIGAPRVIGSLTSASITDGGFGISNGDVFSIQSANGKGGQARVAVTVNGSGQVQFTLMNGGSGYSIANTTVSISNVVSFHGGNTFNTTNFTPGEAVVQNNYVFNVAASTLANGSVIVAYDGTNTAIGNGVVFAVNASTLSVSVNQGSLATANTIALLSNTSINSTVTGATLSTANAKVMAINSIAIGLQNVAGTFLPNSFMRGGTSNCFALSTRVSKGANATFSIGAVSNTEVALTQNIGTILALSSVNPGSGYDTPPMVVLTDAAVAAGGKYDWTVGIANTTGTFISGQRTTAASGASGTIRAANSSTLELIRTYYADTLANNQQIVSYHANGVVSGVANIISVANNANFLMGNNALVSSNATSLAGVVSQVEVIDSGFGYIPNESLTFVSNANTAITFAGLANIQKQGKATGFWKDNSGKLNSDKYIHDNDYYQEYSYEIQTDISIDKYSDVLKKIMHVAGTKFFGSVTKSPAQDVRLQSSGSSITWSPG